jgi:argininosuccinate lyase
MHTETRLEALREEVYQSEGRKFPSAIYSDLVLTPGFEHAVAYYLYDYRQINIAHLQMLVEQKLIDFETAKRIMGAIEHTDYESYKTMRYTGEYEDLYFALEADIIRQTGPRGGLCHLARSRNDIDSTLQRMLVKRHILTVMAEQKRFLRTILTFADAYKDVPTIAHTHSQQAQPSVVGHYFLAVFNLVHRDFQRLVHAYETADYCPMGAAAITTSGFAVNRERVAELLGFRFVQENSYDSIGGSDYALEYAAALQIAAIDLGRMVYELYVWGTQEFGILKVDDAFIQVSSIMPQKRNPVAIEHCRAFLSTVVGQCQTITTMLHNTPYGDINDQEDDMLPFLTGAADTMGKVYHLLSSVIATMQVNTQILEERLDDSFCVITELADTLVREEHISFREAHTVASALVSYCLDHEMKLSQVDYPLIKQMYEKTLAIPMHAQEAVIKASLTARNFIDKRTVEGGIARKPMDEMIAHDEVKLQEMAQWMAENDERMKDAAKECDRLANEMVGKG